MPGTERQELGCAEGCGLVEAKVVRDVGKAERRYEMEFGQEEGQERASVQWKVYSVRPFWGMSQD
jgi:hypothetical protein